MNSVLHRSVPITLNRDARTTRRIDRICLRTFRTWRFAVLHESVC